MKPFQLPNFKSESFFKKAMTHKSYANEQGNQTLSNERLEFLGDAILNFLCGQFLYDRYPQKTEGALTQIRASLVDKQQLSEFAIKLSLNEHILLGKGVEYSGGRANPRLLSSAFEALIGAYFLDGDGEIESVRAYVHPLFLWALNQRSETEQLLNYKSQLQAWALANKAEIPEYAIVGAAGPDHDKRFTAEVRIKGQLFGKGNGPRKQDAEKQAARSALERLDLL